MSFRGITGYGLFAELNRGEYEEYKRKGKTNKSKREWGKERTKTLRMKWRDMETYEKEEYERKAVEKTKKRRQEFDERNNVRTEEETSEDETSEDETSEEETSEEKPKDDIKALVKRYMGLTSIAPKLFRKKLNRINKRRINAMSFEQTQLPDPPINPAQTPSYVVQENGETYWVQGLTPDFVEPQNVYSLNDFVFSNF